MKKRLREQKFTEQRKIIDDHLAKCRKEHDESSERRNHHLTEILEVQNKRKKLEAFASGEWRKVNLSARTLQRPLKDMRMLRRAITRLKLWDCS